jgi:hypothetical protein
MNYFEIEKSSHHLTSAAKIENTVYIAQANDDKYSARRGITVTSS